MTNADAIREMTDNELYDFLQAFEIGDIDYSLTFCSLCKEDAQLDCDECFKRWLFADADDYNGLLKDKGINSGYKTEPSDSEKPNNCKTCKNWDIVNDHCYFIQECRYEPKDEPQTCDTCKYGEDKHRYAHICNECGVGINNYEPKTDCETCKNNKLEWFSEVCDGCSKANSHYEPKENHSGEVTEMVEPQTDCSRYVIVNGEGERIYDCIGCMTDCAWKGEK